MKKAAVAACGEVRMTREEQMGACMATACCVRVAGKMPRELKGKALNRRA